MEKPDPRLEAFIEGYLQSAPDGLLEIMVRDLETQGSYMQRAAATARGKVDEARLSRGEEPLDDETNARYTENSRQLMLDKVRSEINRRRGPLN